MITGTPARRTRGSAFATLGSTPATDFTGDPRFDNRPLGQLHIPGFTQASLVELGVKVRDLYSVGASPRITQRVDDEYVAALSKAVAGRLGDQVGVAPRLFVKKLVGDVLDRVDQFEDFDPRKDYALTVSRGELSEDELAAAGVNDIDLNLD